MSRVGIWVNTLKKTVIEWASVAVLVIASVPAARATDSRSQSLLYNLAFDDQTDVFLFPHLLPDYQGAYFHLPYDPAGIFGGVILGGEDGAFAAFVHRPLATAFDQYRIVVTDMGFPIYSLVTQLPGQVFDLMYGARNWGLGLRLHVWSDVSEQQGMLADFPEVGSVVTTELNGGVSVLQGLDLRTNLVFRYLDDEGALLGVRIGMRYMEPGEHRIRLVVAGEIESGFYFPKDEDKDTSYGFALPFKAGVRFEAVPNRVFVGLLAGLDFQLLVFKYDDAGFFEDDDANARFGLAVPTLELAAEWKALDWLEVRSAIKGGYGIQLTRDPNNRVPKYEQMTFSSGIGLPLGPFSIDAVLQYHVWQSGTYLIGGMPGLFAGVTLAYQWGAEEAPPRLEPAPAEKKPAPAKTAPDSYEYYIDEIDEPAEKKPAPAETAPPPAEGKLGPLETEPEPAGEELFPAEKEPAPAEKKPELKKKEEKEEKPEKEEDGFFEGWGER